MKNYILTTALLTLLISTSAFAQPRKGDWMVGARVSNLNISGGKFLSNRLLLGVDVSPSISIQPYVASSFNLAVSPFLRYYFAPKDGMEAKKFYLFSQIQAGYGLGLNTNNDNLEHSLSPSLGAGLTYMLNDRVSFEASYNIYHPLGDLSSPYRDYGYYLRPQLGVQIYLNGKKKDNKE